MRKIYVLDTSVLAYDPNGFKSFTGNDVIIPVTVLDELDKLKKGSTSAAKNARLAIRALDEVTASGEIHNGISIDGDIMLKIDTSTHDPLGEDPMYGDNRILATAKYVLSMASEGTDVILVSKDINLRTRARAYGMQAEDYEKDKVESGEFFRGIQTITNDDIGHALSVTGHLVIDHNPELQGLYPNECVYFEDRNEDGVCLGRRHKDVVKLIQPQKAWGLNTRNKEQQFAVNLLLDVKVPLVTLIGMAGTGKSLMAVAAALEMVIEKKQYSKIIIYRPIQPVGNDIGYLPGPQPLDAKILTPNGWSTMGDISPGDLVIGSDGKAKKVLKIFPKGKKEIFKVEFSDGSSTECCEDHLWFTGTVLEREKGGNQGSVKSLKMIMENIKYGKAQANNQKSPVIKPVEFPKINNIINPYILGVLLGDGTLTEKYSVYFTSGDEQIFKNCSELTPSGILCKVKSKSSINENNVNYNFISEKNLGRKHRSVNIFAQEIKRLKLLGKGSGTKFIPDEYKFNSIENRLALLQGLMDTDGYVDKEGSDVSFSTTSAQLAEDVQFLVESLGGYSSIKTKVTYYSDKVNAKIKVDSKVVSITLPQGMCPFRLDRKIERFKQRKYDLGRFICKVTNVGVKEAKCILIDSDDHLYATDHLILTHNTLEEKLGPWMGAIIDSFEVCFDNKSSHAMFEQYCAKGIIEMNAITHIRGRSIPNAFIIVDEVQNLSKEDVKTILTRAGEGTKIVLTGDIEQIDNSYLDALNNGLTYVVEKFKDSELAGHVTFAKGERSPLATEAARIL
jgi:predicted ribonuclease YlaK